MDFLDPKKRKAHRRRLVFGYALMSILITIGTMVLLYLSYGYDVDRKTGQVIQNGIVFLDSKPQGASVYLNDVLQPNTTNTRLDIPSGTYTVKLQRDSYRNWERTFNINGGQFQRLVYPLLIPNILETTDVETYDAVPLLTTQSPDRRWLLVQQAGSVYQFDMFDLLNPEDDPTTVQIPIELLTQPTAKSSLQYVEWSTDNRHLIFKRTYGDKKTEYIMFDRENPNESINLNKALGINPVEISLKDKRPDQFYFLDTKPGVLRTADTKNKTISAPLANAVHTYSTYGDDLVMFATTDEVEKNRAEIRILEGADTYTVREVTKSDNYVLEISRFDNEWYYVAGSSADGLAHVFEDPLKSLKSDNKPLNVKSLIRMDNPRFTSFSANTQFISVQSGSKLAVLDLYDNEQYYTELDHVIKPSQEIKWMDGHRFVYVVNNQSYIIDFDGSNENTLVTSLGVVPYFDRDYDNVFTLEGSKSDPSKQALTLTILDLNQ